MLALVARLPKITWLAKADGIFTTANTVADLVMMLEKFGAVIYFELPSNFIAGRPFIEFSK
jgi:hypothetical protein